MCHAVTAADNPECDCGYEFGQDVDKVLKLLRGQLTSSWFMLALALACASTVLSFGLLATSEIPALRSLGQVVGIGILLALLWSPAGLVLLSPRKADG